MKVLTTILFKSVGAGYVGLNLAGEQASQTQGKEEIEVLEFCPLGELSQLLITGKLKSVSAFISQLPGEDILKAVTVENPHEKILKAYLGAEVQPLQSEVLVIEAAFVGDLFKYANQLLEKKLQIVDLRVFRTTNSVCYLTMTGETIQEHLKSLKLANIPGIKITSITKLSDGFKSYLDLRPR